MTPLMAGPLPPAAPFTFGLRSRQRAQRSFDSRAPAWSGCTAWPGDPGNVGLAGHRDTFFRRLGDIQPDDEIRLVTPEGTLLYRVERTFVVDPEDVWVLDPTREQALTLVTCYPFSFIGAAPQRFIVRALRIG